MSTIQINKDNFQEEVMNSDKPVLLDFWAPWCTPCRMIAPVVDEIAAENPHIKVGKVNVDEEMDLAMQYRAYTIPTLMVIKDGRVSAQAVGARPKAQILSLL